MEYQQEHCFDGFVDHISSVLIKALTKALVEASAITKNIILYRNHIIDN